MALPREAREVSNFNGLTEGLGKKRIIEFQGISELPPKPSLSESYLVVDSAALPATAREVCDQRHLADLQRIGR